MSGERRGLFFATLACLSLSATSTLGQPPLRERVLRSLGPDDVAFFASPTPGSERFRFLLALIARSARVPIGFEEIAGSATPLDGDLSAIPQSTRTVLVGLQVGDALNALVSADSRYRWHEQSGVILMRPVQSWEDSDHFLHQPVQGFHVNDSTASEVVRTIYERLGMPITYAESGFFGNPPKSGTLQQRITFDLSSGTLAEVLNNVVRAYGGVGWMVHYARAPASIDTSCVRVLTFDGEFSGVGAAGCESTAGVAVR